MFRLCIYTYLGFVFVLRPGESVVIIAEIRHGHQEHCHDGFRGGGHGVGGRVVDVFGRQRIVKGQENDVVS